MLLKAIVAFGLVSFTVMVSALQPFVPMTPVPTLQADSAYEMGVLLHEQQRYIAAIDFFTQAIQANFPQAYHARGLSFAALGQTEEALQDFSQAIVVNPQNADAYYQQGVILWTMGNESVALADMNQAIELQPDGIYLSFRGEILLSLGDLSDALADFSAAIAQNFTPAYLYRAQVYMLQGEDERALRDYDTYLERFPASRDGLLGRARLYTRQGNYLVALEDYDTLLEYFPDDTEGRLSRAEVWVEQENFDAARADLDRLIDENLNLALAYLLRGRIFQALDAPNRALEDYNQAWALDNENPELYYRRGLLYIQLSETENALADLQAFLEKAPLDEPRRSQVETLLAGLEQ